MIPGGRSAVDLYFIQDDGGMFKTTVTSQPYFYVGCKVRETRRADDSWRPREIDASFLFCSWGPRRLWRSGS